MNADHNSKDTSSVTNGSPVSNQITIQQPAKEKFPSRAFIAAVLAVIGFFIGLFTSFLGYAEVAENRAFNQMFLVIGGIIISISIFLPCYIIIRRKFNSSISLRHVFAEALFTLIAFWFGWFLSLKYFLYTDFLKQEIIVATTYGGNYIVRYGKQFLTERNFRVFIVMESLLIPIILIIIFLTALVELVI